MQQNKKRINVLAYGGETKEIMENRAKLFNPNNISIIPVFGDMSHIFTVNDALSVGEVVTMPCDRIFGSVKSVECDFLSGKADFPIGAFTLAAHFDVPVISVFVMKKSVSKYHVYVQPITIEDSGKLPKREKAELLARAFVKELEAVLRKYPEQWFNFYNFWK